MTIDGPAITNEPLCHRCVEHIQTCLDQLPHYLKALEAFKAKSLVPQGGGTKVGSSATPATPINVHVLDVIHDISTLWIEHPIADLIYQQDGVYLALRVQKLWKQADSIVGIQRVWSRRFGSCPRCELKTLGGWDGEDLILCSSCGHQMTHAAYAAHCLISSTKKEINES